MELRVLRYFLAVAQEETITAAADSLHVTQPTLSKQLMDLEKEFGKPLFLRGKRKITLTEEGLFLRKRAQEIVDLADKTERELLMNNSIINGEIFIGGGETKAIQLIAQVIKELQKTYPDIRYHLFSGNGEDVTERLNKGLIDFALFVGKTNLKNYDYLKLPIADRWGLLMHKDMPLAKQTAITPQDLYGISLLCSRQSLIQNELSDWLNDDFENLSIIGSYNLIYNAAQMAEEKIAYVIGIDGLINTTGNSDLCFRPFSPEITATSVIAWKKNQVFSKAAEKFRQVLQSKKLFLHH